jgi:hypothetical protein
MILFIDDHRHVYGVEPICRVLPIAPSTYYAHVARRRDPSRRSARSRRDEVLCREIGRVWRDNRSVHGVRKVWHQLLREGIEVARCTVARLMRRLGLRGVVRGKAVKTTVSDPATPCPRDKVNRRFQAERPDQLRGEPLSATGPRTVGERLHLRRVVARVRLVRGRARTGGAQAPHPSSATLSRARLSAGAPRRRRTRLSSSMLSSRRSMSGRRSKMAVPFTTRTAGANTCR